MARPNRGLTAQSSEVTKSWFAVFNNPADHGYIGSPEEVCHRLRDEWCTTNTRTGAWLYCISQAGLHHVHMVLEDVKAMRFTAIKKSYAIGMHFEATKGTKAEVEAYINKTGIFEEKGEDIIYCVKVGEIKGVDGKTSELKSIYNLIEQGLTPKEVLYCNPNYYKYSTYIKQMYYDKRDRETDIVRDVKVVWHTGESGSGKSFSRIDLANEVGEDNIFYLTAFGNGAFDGYNGQAYLWIEDFKGELPFGELLRILDVYKAEIHARYANIKALWKEVHITSIYHPKGIYNKMVKEYERGQERQEQLMRRISFIRYHWKDIKGYHYSDFHTETTIDEMEKSAKKGEEWRFTNEAFELCLHGSDGR